MARRIRFFQRRARRKLRLNNLPEGASDTFGGLARVLDKLDRDALIEGGGFSAHTPYVCGEPEEEPKSRKISVAISTENLLLNAWRSEQFGVPAFVAIDTTHRLILEGHNVMPVITVSVDQKSHIIGYGICDKEDAAAHNFVMHALYKEVHEVVKRYAISGMNA